LSVTKVGEIRLIVVHTDGGKYRTIVTPSGRHFQIASPNHPASDPNGSNPLDVLCRLLCDAEEVS
jgi:hypothetical protein